MLLLEQKKDFLPGLIGPTVIIFPSVSILKRREGISGISHFLFGFFFLFESAVRINLPKINALFLFFSSSKGTFTPLQDFAPYRAALQSHVSRAVAMQAQQQWLELRPGCCTRPFCNKRFGA